MCGVIADHSLDKRLITHMHFHTNTLSDDRSKCVVRKGNELVKADAFPWHSSNSCITFIGGHGPRNTICQGSVAYHGYELADKDLTLCRYSTCIEADCYVHRGYRDAYLLPFGSTGRRELTTSLQRVVKASTRGKALNLCDMSNVLLYWCAQYHTSANPSSLSRAVNKVQS